SLETETAMFLQSFLTEDRDYRDLLDADFTFMNDRLADLYKYPGASGFTKEFKRVSFANTTATLAQRGGVLTQGALLAGTSVPLNTPTAEVSETSVIVRGK